jgi:hypothetical protein
MTRRVSPPWSHPIIASHISGPATSRSGCCGLDQKIVSGVPMSLKRVANVLGTDAMLFQEFCDRLSKYSDKTLTLFADGTPVEIPVF